ncbi:MAG: hypothetical protein ACK56I_09465, partial [bacterium]
EAKSSTTRSIPPIGARGRGAVRARRVGRRPGASAAARSAVRVVRARHPDGIVGIVERVPPAPQLPPRLGRVVHRERDVVQAVAARHLRGVHVGRLHEEHQRAALALPVEALDVLRAAEVGRSPHERRAFSHRLGPHLALPFV